jgi:hypothetical protein
VAKIIATVMSKSYMPALNSGPVDESGYSKACLKDGKNYCCSEGVNYFYIDKVKICEKVNGEWDEEVGTWVSTGGNNDLPLWEEDVFVKGAALVQYGCNQQARRKQVSLRFNGKMELRCKDY